MGFHKHIIITLCFLFSAFYISPVHAAETLEPVTIKLKWKHQFQFAGYYAAIEKGFYAQEGLNVQLKERAYNEDNIKTVVEGKAEYGVTDSSLVLNRLMGEPVVLMAQIFQHSPLIFLSKRQSGIYTPLDMVDKKVMLTAGDKSEAPLAALLLETLGGLGKVKSIPRSYNLDDFINGNVDVIGGYLTNEPFILRQQGIETNIIDPRTYGMDFYGDNLFTTEKEIYSFPGRAERVTRATIKGWNYALKHQDEIISLIHQKYAPKLTRKQLEYEARMTAVMILPELISIGEVNQIRYQKTLETYVRLGMVETSKIPPGFFYEDRLSVMLSSEEKAWLMQHPKIQVGIMDAWPPMNYVNTLGNPKGIGVDYIKELNALLNIELVIVPGPFKKNFDLVKEKKLDALLDITPKKEREPFFNFTCPYLVIPHVIVGRHDEPDIKSEKDLADRTIALEQGFYNVKYFRKNYPRATVKEYGSTSEAMGAVIRGEADAYAGNRAVVIHLMGKELINSLEIKGRMEKPPTILSIGVRKDWPELEGILNKALAAIPEEKHREIHQRWISSGKAKEQHLLDLTVKEEAWLAEHPTISVAIDKMWAPVESVNSDGQYEGLSRDLLDKITQMLGIKFQAVTDLSWAAAVERVKRGEADMFSAVMQTQERASYLSFTDNYLDLQQMIFTRNDHPYVHDLSDFHGRRICVIKGYAVTEFIRRDYPAIELIEAENAQEAMTMLTTGQVEAYVDSLLTTTYHIMNAGFANIKVAGDASYRIEIGMAVRKELAPLVPILNKALAAITEEEKHQLFHRWRSIRHEVGFDYSLLWKVLLPIVFVLVTVLYWNRKLSREVVERQRAEQETSKVASLLRATIDSTSDGILVVDREQKITSYNKQFLNIWHIDRKLLDTTDDDEVLLKTILAQLQDPDTFQNRVRHLYANPEEEDFTILSLRDGRILERYSKPQKLNNRIVGRVWSCRDVTKRHKIEADLRKLSSAVKQSPASVVITDRDGIIEYVNPTFSRVTGYSYEEAIGQNPRVLKSGDLSPDFYKELWETILSGKIWTGDMINKRKNGEDFWESVAIAPLLDNSGVITHFVAVKEDISGRKRMEQDLLKAKEAAEAATQAKGAFLANMSHEIRTPMNAILGFLELVLEDQSLPELHRKYLTTAHISANGLLGLINDILDISKMESSKFTIESRPFSLKQLMDEIMKTMDISTRKKGLKLQLETQVSLSGSFVGDPLRLRQIIINLLGNAIKFTQKGSVCVQIMPAEKKDQLHFIIKDTGIGISPNRLSRIFDSFTQADTSTTRKFGGTGLGTTIAKELVEIMGGRIWAESEKGKGSTFHFIINLPSTDQVPEHTDLFVIPGKAVLLSTRRGFRILLAEDVEANVDLAKIRLEQQGHKITVAWNGRKAVEAVLQGDIDVILMDVHMPEMDGIEATKRIRSQEADTGRHVPIIAMTAAVMKIETKKYFEVGMDAVVAKPIDFGKLFKVMEEVVPEGVGEVVPEIEKGPDPLAGLEFQKLEGIDTHRGLKSWQDPEAYSKALLGFLNDYRNAATDLAHFIEKGEIDNAYHMAHALKGVAGNLAITQVANAVSPINIALRENRIEDVEGHLPTFAVSLKSAIDAIGQLETEQDLDAPTKEINVPHITELFIKMLAAFNELNPYIIKPFLSELNTYLSQEQLNPIVDCVGRFDFEGAQQETIKLTETLKIDLGGLDEKS